jgi:hypothetical protein
MAGRQNGKEPATEAPRAREDGEEERCPAIPALHESQNRKEAAKMAAEAMHGKITY